MKTNTTSRQLIIAGSILAIALIILICGTSLNSLNKQQDLVTAFKNTNSQLLKVHRVDLTIYQMDIARIRYRRTGLNMFRLAFEQKSDSLTAQINELLSLSKNDSAQKNLIEAVFKGITELKMYWQLPVNRSDIVGGKNKLRIAMEEETKVANIRSDLDALDENLYNHLSGLHQINQKNLGQTRKVITVSAALAILILISIVINISRIQDTHKLN